MQLEIPAPLASDNARLFGPTPAMARPALNEDADGGGDATLRLLRSCVEAMSLLQAKVEAIDTLVTERLAAEDRELVAIRADMATVQTAIAAGGAQIGDAVAKVTRVEASLQEFESHHADDVAAARADATTWRMRVETDSMAFEQLSARLASLETGLSAKLVEATQEIAQQKAETARVQNEARIVETASDHLRSRLSTLDATIADQRARITCLQNKLATATYAIRFEQMSRTMQAGEHDILDLAQMTIATKSLVSAA